MLRSSGWAGLRLLGAGVLIFFLLSSFDQYLQAETVTGVRITQTSDESVTLPFHWIAERDQIQQRWFEFEFDGASLDSHQLSIYLPAFEQRIALWLNGVEIQDSDFRSNWYGPITIANAFVEIPNGVIKPEINQLRVLVETGPLVFGSLGTMVIANTDELWMRAAIRSFMHKSLPQMFFGVFVMLIIVCGVAVYRQPNDRNFVWLLVTIVPVTLFSFGYLSEHIPAYRTIIPNFLTLAPLSTIGYVGLSYSLEDKPSPTWVKISVCLVVVLALGINAVPVDYLRPVVLAVTLPLFIAFLIVAAFRFYRLSHVMKKGAFWLLALGQTILIFAVIHDGLARALLLEEWTFLWTSTVRSVLIVAVVVYVFSIALNRAETQRVVNLTIERRLAEREQELNAIYLLRQQEEQDKLIAHERNRIFRDLHDGVAGQLVMISTLLSKPEFDTNRIQNLCRSALADLRTVVSSLAIGEGDLGFALGLYREKYLNQINQFDMKISWQMQHLPEVIGFRSGDVLNLVRVLQEAQSNALKHGAAESIDVSAVHLSDKAVITFENHGLKPYQPGRSGIGLKSMVDRVQQLNGEIEFTPLHDGMRVTIRLPIATDPETGALRLSRD